VTGEEIAPYQAARQPYLGRQQAAGSSLDLAQDVMDGRVRFVDIDHPDRVRVQDFAVQAGQGRVADRANERLGKSDTAIILWRKIMEREFRAIEEGRPVKQWTPAPEEVVPTLGF
jgi:5,5'-dehydrodivanillate O-demethylase